MVSVSRGTVESSDILVVVADNRESIEKPSQAAERLPRLRYHCTPKGVSLETGRWKLAQGGDATPSNATEVLANDQLFARFKKISCGSATGRGNGSEDEICPRLQAACG